MTDAVVAINAGSSSIKFALYDGQPGTSDVQVIATGLIEGIGHRLRLDIRNRAGNNPLTG